MSSVRSSLLWVFALSVSLAACASGGGSSSDDTQQPVDAGHLIDSRVFTVPDGTVVHDSGGLQPDTAVLLPDASFQLPDADMSGGACAQASDCTDPSNTCCSILSMTCGPDPGVPFNLILCAP